MSVLVQLRWGVGVFLMGLLLSGCADGWQIAKDNMNQNNSSQGQTGPTPAPTAVPTPAPTPVASEKLAVPPLWEAKRPTDGTRWTEHAVRVLEADGAALLAGADDIASFCPSYSRATHRERLNFWVYLISAVVKYESAFSPTCHFAETTMGIDPVTQLPVYSDGLLQLSYQDVRAYPFCNEFDWTRDRNLAENDPAKTIFDPYKNLTCGIRILNDQVRRKGLLAVRGYWSTLFPPDQNVHSKVPEIKALTTQLSFCRQP